MASVGIPVLIWQDHHGQYTAVTLEGYYGAQAAYDETRAGALQQLKRYFEWQVKTNDMEPETDFFNPELFHVRVRIRPEYQGGQAGNRRYPCESTVELRVPCVRGTTAGDILCCSIPTLGIGFYCHDPSALQTMVTERVRQELSGRTPQELSRLMAPKHLELDQVLVKSRTGRRRSDRYEYQLTALPPVADPMAGADFRKSYSPAYRREPEVSSLGKRLRTRPGSLLLVGEDGVGKTTLLAAAVRAAERSSDNETNQDSGKRHHCHFWHSSAARLIAGMRYLGQWQERCQAVIEELSRIGGVLCLESLIDLVRIGGSNPTASVGAFLLPYLQTGQLRLVAEATPAELDACRRLLPGFAQPFEIMQVSELAVREAGEALDEISAAGARDLRVEVDDGVSNAVLRLHRRFMPYHPLPGRAGSFLRALLDRARQQKAKGIDIEQVFGQFVRETGLPEIFLDDEQPLPMDEVYQSLRKQVIGQDDACRAVARLVCTFKTGLNDPGRPVGSLLFCGPTGVGKTQLARTLSEYLFGHGDQAGRLIRLDMSEYSAPWAAQRLVTSPDGTPSDFIAKVRRQPFVVVLFDEIEKAAPEVFDMLLGLLDEGRLTDRYGRTTWFRTAIVIMTSNLGSKNANSIGFGDESADTYEREIRGFFRPEFFNRLDGVVTFGPLNRETCRLVVEKELNDLVHREGFTRRDLKPRCSDALVDHLVQQGFDARYGARPLQRTIEQQVVSQLSRFLIENQDARDGWLEIDFDPISNNVNVQHATE